MLRLRLGLDLIGEDDGAINAAPTDIIWAGSHAVAEDAELGTVVGGALSAIDPELDAVTFTLADDAAGKFAIGNDGTSIIVSGVLDYETATSHSITIRASDGALTYDEAFTITVTDVSESVPENPLPPDGEVIVDDAASYDVLPSVTVVSEGVKAHGKKKATGATAKFLYDYLDPTANTTIVIQYDPDFSLLTDSGIGAFVGFGFKTGNAFQLIGPKGDGSTGLHKVKITGDSPSGWSQSSGHTISDGGAVANGTQAGPNWIALTFSVDGTTATLRSSGDNAATWSNEYVAAASSPLSNWIGNDESGVAGYLPETSSGAFSVNFLDAYVVPAPTITSSNTKSQAENATMTHALTANQTVTWSIVGGADQARCEISGSTLRWVSNGTKDYETPNDADTNNTYVVTVRATNTFGNYVDQTITVTVTDVDDTAPTITSSNAVSVAENATLAHSLTANETVTWSVVSGADLAKFEISGSTLRWASNGTKNYEAPDDSNADNAYVVTVRATDTASNASDQTITVNVTNVSENTTWNPSDKSANITLSNGNLTASATSAGGSYSTVRAIAGKTSGKFYFEVTESGASSANELVGIANASASLTSYLGINNNSIGFNGASQIMRSNAQVGTDGSHASGQTKCVAVDRDNNMIWFRVNGGDWNGNAANNPATNTGGVAISAVAGTIYPAATGYITGDIFVANFGDSAFTYGVPSGFTAGWPS